MLVGECDAGVVVILPDVGVAVVKDHLGDELVVRVREGRQSGVPVLGHLVPDLPHGQLFDRPKAIEVFVDQRDRLVSSPLVLGN